MLLCPHSLPKDTEGDDGGLCVASGAWWVRAKVRASGVLLDLLSAPQ